MKITAVVVSRNDNYGEHLLERATYALNSAINTYDEVIYVDWNSPTHSLLWDIKDNLQLKGNLNDKKSYLRRLKIPLDKYSLTFIRTIYNETKIDQDFHLGRDLGMGSVKSIDHYNSINNFIDELSKQISLETNKDFFPIYLDIIQAGVNNLNWYTVNIQR
jgi:hypothetical protein